ncbi:NAD(P)H-dependent oxidoreductase [Ruminococcus sp.]|uniref:NAD(P)H-dependent oxidoreductase n=1 Tax=Ruminococcus sp. TaxID=41978 RepID=UPI0025EB101D|nr:NAD(P)H-dependent oxidoreductase [Ruminococcus sp.]MBQ8967403.1 NAD(P)H-dependent oxidoreductase [Ruminococcus sp.]
MKILYIDATVRKESRTAKLAAHLLEKLEGDVEQVKLCETLFPVTDEAYLAERDKACGAGEFSGEIFGYARQFAAADIIVIAAPFWDLSFPAALKQYFEHINVVGLTFAYTDEGRPVGLCAVKKLFYVTTAGGGIFAEEYGYGYVKALAQGFYGIEDCVCFKAEGLDIYGADVRMILEKAFAEVDEYFA